MYLQWNLAPCQYLLTEQQTAQFTHKRKLRLSHKIWIIFPQQDADFTKLSRKIWQKFPRKTVGPLSITP